MSDPDLRPSLATPLASPWGRIILVVSLGLNLLFLGAVGGALLRDRPFGRAPVLRDLNFGLVTEALTRQDRERLRRSVQDAAPDLRTQRRDVENDLVQLLTILRAPEFRRDDMAGLFLRLNDRALQRQKLGQELLLDLLEAMPSDARAAFADRLETTIRRRKKAAAP